MITVGTSLTDIFVTENRLFFFFFLISMKYFTTRGISPHFHCHYLTLYKESLSENVSIILYYIHQVYQAIAGNCLARSIAAMFVGKRDLLAALVFHGRDSERALTECDRCDVVMTSHHASRPERAVIFKK